MGNLDLIHNAKSNSFEKFSLRNEDGLFYLSHASILVRLNGKKFLFDPVLAKPPHLGSWLFYPEMQIDCRMLEVDGVFVSHQHQDHYDIDFLKLLPTSTKIYIIGGRPQFSRMFEREGLKCIEIPEKQQFNLGDGITCAGILHEYNGIDSAIAISNSAFTVFHGNDCFASNEKLKTIKNIYETINVACVPFAYVHWYPFLLDEVDESWKRSEAERLIRKYLDIALRQVEYLQPEIAIPFGANMFYCDDIESKHNKAVLSPFDLKNYATKNSFALEEKVQALFSGDAIYSTSLNKGRYLEIEAKEFSENLLRSGFQNFLKRVQREGTGFDPTEINNVSEEKLSSYAFITDRLRILGESPNERIYISNADDPTRGHIEINLASHEVFRSAQIRTDLPFHHFRLTNFAYKAYFSQKYTFNEIIASSQFRLVRQPNEYRLNILSILNNYL